MPLEPDAEQAARALEDVRHRRQQAIAAQREPRWFFLAWGAVLFLTFATPDLLPLLHLERWSVWWMGVLGPLTVVFLLGQYTRRGRSLFGLPPELEPRAFLPPGAPGSAGWRYPWAGFLVVVGVVGVLSVGSAWLLSYVPGWRLILGLLLGLTVAFPSSRRFERLQRLSRSGACP
ncbi:hypothetical protein EST92_11955 [Streptomyces sp. TM32]|uniref:hypothetical protein n=1 Tax=Streptomyces sp. TM32 TaxID=1652669 RepID=UPI001010F2E1|nr:hypothetical protein [Streptomyces sp. TM32]RXS84124.1 hypothetical protein EST92_11955 [Streptomyces sp. TM32]